MSETLYIQTDKNVEVHRPHVYLQDVAQLACSDSKTLDCFRALPVLNMDPKKPGRYVITVTDIIEKIQKKDHTVDVTHVGEPTFIITYEAEKHEHKVFSYLKTALVCLITFFGTAFSIMTFNNDVDVGKLFDQIYVQFMGQQPSGFNILHLSYSVGIGLGVLFFFNHFGRKKITQDPTPMQVQMRLYEDDVDTTIIEEICRKEDQECGSR